MVAIRPLLQLSESGPALFEGGLGFQDGSGLVGGGGGGCPAAAPSRTYIHATSSSTAKTRYLQVNVVLAHNVYKMAGY
jgi:hypothetical protein